MVRAQAQARLREQRAERIRLQLVLGSRRRGIRTRPPAPRLIEDERDPPVVGQPLSVAIRGHPHGEEHPIADCGKGPHQSLRRAASTARRS